MAFPNVLAQALSVIPRQTIRYKKFIKNIPNDVGNLVPQYAPEKITEGSLQPAGAQLLWKLGIANVPDLYVCYLRADVVSEVDATSNDIITDANGNVFNIFRTDRWFQYPCQDWNKIIVQRKKNYGHKN